MEQSQVKYKLLMFFLTLIIIYIFGVIGDYLLHLKQYSKRKDANEIITLRKQNEDRKFIAEAKSQNYVRLIYPYLIHKIPEIEKKFIKDIVPIGAQPNKYVYDCNEGYGLTKYKTDRFGLRNNDNIWDNLELTKKEKILYIGDSFVNGDCVDDKYIISNNLNDFYNINLGLSGNDPYTYSSLSKIFIPVVKPKYVVLIFFENDNSPDGKVFLKNLKIKDIHSRYIKNSNGKIKLSNEIIKIVENIENYILNIQKNKISGSRPNIFNRASRYFSLPTIRNTIKEMYIYYFFKIPESTKLSIDILNEECKIYNCIPIYGFIPSSSFWEPSSIGLKYKDSIEKYLNKNENNFIDFSNIIKNIGENKAYAPKGTHLSPDGYKSISITINKFIKNQIKN